MPTRIISDRDALLDTDDLPRRQKTKRSESRQAHDAALKRLGVAPGTAFAAAIACERLVGQDIEGFHDIVPALWRAVERRVIHAGVADTLGWLWGRGTYLAVEAMACREITLRDKQDTAANVSVSSVCSDAETVTGRRIRK
jgi:hypothetical protein